MFRLTIILDSGSIERVYPKTIQGKKMAIAFLKESLKKRNVLGHKFSIYKGIGVAV